MFSIYALQKESVKLSFYCLKNLFIMWCESQTILLEILKYTLLLTDHHTVEYITKIYFLHLSEISIPLMGIFPFLHISSPPPIFLLLLLPENHFSHFKKEEILSTTTLIKWENTVVTELN